MRRSWALAPGLLGVVLVALSGIGQGQSGIGDPGEGTRLALLRIPAVQKELKLTQKQKAEVERLGEAAKAAKKEIDKASKSKAKGAEKTKKEEIPKGLPDPEKEARDAAFAALESESDAKLRKLLGPEQADRLSQIALQVEGPRAFLKPELIGALDLGDDQVEEIGAILGVIKAREDQAKEAQKRSAELGTFALEKVTKDQQKGQLRGTSFKLGRRAMVEIGRVLSKRQRDKYAKMIGEPFDLAGLADANGRKIFDDSADLGPSLLRMPAIRQELEVTAEQAKGLDRGDLAAKVLKPGQTARLSEIALQAEGASAFTRPEIIRSLKLSDEQVEQIDAILDGLGEGRRSLREAAKKAEGGPEADPGPDPEVEKARKEQRKEKLRAEADQLGREIMPRIAAVLTRSQREAFRKKLGEPFDFSKLQGAGNRPVDPPPPIPKER